MSAKSFWSMRSQNFSLSYSDVSWHTFREGLLSWNQIHMDCIKVLSSKTNDPMNTKEHRLLKIEVAFRRAVCSKQRVAQGPQTPCCTHCRPCRSVVSASDTAWVDGVLPTWASSSSVKSFFILKVLRISSGVFPLIMLATVLHVTSSKPLMSK